MKTRVMLAAAGGGLLFFALGVLRAFWGAFIFPPPNPKFGGATSFYLGSLLFAFLAACLAVSLLATIPLLLRRVGPRSLRYLLIYSSAFVLVLAFPAAPAFSALASLFIRFFRVLGTPEAASMILSVLVSYIIAALAYYVLVSGVSRFLQRRNRWASAKP